MGITWVDLRVLKSGKEGAEKESQEKTRGLQTSIVGSENELKEKETDFPRSTALLLARLEF